ncbi:uncharacterized protein J4E92_009717 [Alternaria infectoria]|uniref:uncharacterized protein n=1 Tax=Alternaria infectoria TaxID=45303 RepID=UPI0022209D3B|nr:uncharacterized protein J4E92_009717 [Alternaria infectoria]KAI4914303.1 hypothetical protein J4E92_009717 [Alternaria infectoria]
MTDPGEAERQLQIWLNASPHFMKKDNAALAILEDWEEEWGGESSRPMSIFERDEGLNIGAHHEAKLDIDSANRSASPEQEPAGQYDKRQATGIRDKPQELPTQAHIRDTQAAHTGAVDLTQSSLASKSSRASPPDRFKSPTAQTNPATHSQTAALAHGADGSSRENTESKVTSEKPAQSASRMDNEVKSNTPSPARLKRSTTHVPKSSVEKIVDSAHANAQTDMASGQPAESEYLATLLAGEKAV